MPFSCLRLLIFTADMGKCFDYSLGTDTKSHWPGGFAWSHEGCSACAWPAAVSPGTRPLAGLRFAGLALFPGAVGMVPRSRAVVGSRKIMACHRYHIDQLCGRLVAECPPRLHSRDSIGALKVVGPSAWSVSGVR